MQAVYTDEQIIARARAWEALHGPDWTWFEVRAIPSQLMRLTIAGAIKVTGLRGRATTYKVREASEPNSARVAAAELDPPGLSPRGALPVRRDSFRRVLRGQLATDAALTRADREQRLGEMGAGPEDYD